MGSMVCSKCGREMSDRAWSCPECGQPAEEPNGDQGRKEISTRGMVLLLVIFIFFPVLLFLLHLFVPEM